MKNVEELCVLIEEIIGESQGSAEDEKITPETQLLVSGLLDSLTIMKIITRLEARTGISFPEASVIATNFRTPTALWTAFAAVKENSQHESVAP